MPSGASLPRKAGYSGPSSAPAHPARFPDAPGRGGGGTRGRGGSRRAARPRTRRPRRPRLAPGSGRGLEREGAGPCSAGRGRCPPLLPWPPRARASGFPSAPGVLGGGGAGGRGARGGRGPVLRAMAAPEPAPRRGREREDESEDESDILEESPCGRWQKRREQVGAGLGTRARGPAGLASPRAPGAPAARSVRGAPGPGARWGQRRALAQVPAAPALPR